MLITFSSPRAPLEVVHFWYQMKAHIFLFANPKFQLQILCSFGDITKNVKLNGIPENNVLCTFIIASYPGVHTFFCLWGVNKKLLRGETSKCISEVKVNQLEVKNMHVKMGIAIFKSKTWLMQRIFQLYI